MLYCIVLYCCIAQVVLLAVTLQTRLPPHCYTEYCTARRRPHFYGLGAVLLLTSGHVEQVVPHCYNEEQVVSSLL